MKSRKRTTLTVLALAGALVVAGGVAHAATSAADFASPKPGEPNAEVTQVFLDSGGANTPVATTYVGEDLPEGIDPAFVTESAESSNGWQEVLPDGSIRQLDGLPPVEGEMERVFADLADALVDAGAVPAGTTAQDVAGWLLGAPSSAPFNASDPEIAKILAEHGVSMAIG